MLANMPVRNNQLVLFLAALLPATALAVAPRQVVDSPRTVRPGRISPNQYPGDPLSPRSPSSGRFLQNHSTGPAQAAGEPNSPESASGRFGTSELFMKMMLSVLLVVGLGSAAIYTSRKLMGKISKLPGKRIKIVETAHLGPRKAVHLLRIGNRWLLIGSTNENITRLAELRPEVAMQGGGFGEGVGQVPDSKTEPPGSFERQPGRAEATMDVSSALAEDR